VLGWTPPTSGVSYLLGAATARTSPALPSVLGQESPVWDTPVIRPAAVTPWSD